ncbi:MAG: hypothetical protein Q4G02_00515 [bacterium]|nr:hypothetical protein [bacterium]
MSEMMHCVSIHHRNAPLSEILNVGEVASAIKSSVYNMTRSNGIRHYLFVFVVANAATGQTENFTLALRESADQWQNELFALLLRTQRPAAHHQQGLIDIEGALRCYKNTSLDCLDNRCFYLFFCSDGTQEQDDAIADKAYEQFLELAGVSQEETSSLRKSTLVETARESFGKQPQPAEQTEEYEDTDFYVERSDATQKTPRPYQEGDFSSHS